MADRRRRRSQRRETGEAEDAGGEYAVRAIYGRCPRTEKNARRTATCAERSSDARGDQRANQGNGRCRAWRGKGAQGSGERGSPAERLDVSHTLVRGQRSHLDRAYVG